eukprot:TRINITY_DN57123_c0_g1_i1.p2 TRINITY_DN57123_c0_g1~~TRINITY_DN57123_c0_g1_i1.p2  ORF type:complete len:111 (+),score=16.68 TRINITY_DN57123_c0_g1_i1:55-387(+)
MRVGQKLWKLFKIDFFLQYFLFIRQVSFWGYIIVILVGLQQSNPKRNSNNNQEVEEGATSLISMVFCQGQRDVIVLVILVSLLQRDLKEQQQQLGGQGRKMPSQELIDFG